MRPTIAIATSTSPMPTAMTAAPQRGRPSGDGLHDSTEKTMASESPFNREVGEDAHVPGHVDTVRSEKLPANCEAVATGSPVCYAEAKRDALRPQESTTRAPA